jgi:hypothetical protein
MWQDPIVEEVRAVRRQYAETFNFDLKQIYADLQQQEEQSQHKRVSFAPKPAVVLGPVKSSQNQ